jgi:hypothetical protein
MVKFQITTNNLTRSIRLTAFEKTVKAILVMQISQNLIQYTILFFLIIVAELKINSI